MKKFVWMFLIFSLLLATAGTVWAGVARPIQTQERTFEITGGLGADNIWHYLWSSDTLVSDALNSVIAPLRQTETTVAEARAQLTADLNQLKQSAPIDDYISKDAQKTTLEGQIANIDAQINALDPKSKDYNTQLAKLNDQKATLTGELNEVTAQINNLLTNYPNLLAQVKDAEDLQNALDALEGKDDNEIVSSSLGIDPQFLKDYYEAYYNAISNLKGSEEIFIATVGDVQASGKTYNVGLTESGKIIYLPGIDQSAGWSSYLPGRLKYQYRTSSAVDVATYHYGLRDVHCMSFARAYVSPLVLDLNGDRKIEASGGVWEPHRGIKGRQVLFDINGDGFEEAVEWIGAGDGILVSAEFAAGGKEPSSLDFIGSAGGFNDGFEKLSLYDLDHNNVIEGKELDALRVWQDKNGDAIPANSEIKTLASLGITAINISHTPNYVGSFVCNGKSCYMWDWWPSYEVVKKVTQK